MGNEDEMSEEVNGLGFPTRTPVDAVAEFLHTGGPPLAADDAAVAIVDALKAAGFTVLRTGQAESFHILHPSPSQVPLPVTFYLSREIMEDDGITDRECADILGRDLETAVAFHRGRLKGSGA